MTKTYLGDSVYVEFQPQSGMLKLTTENGLPSDPSNAIYLEPETYRALVRFVERVWRSQHSGDEGIPK